MQFKRMFMFCLKIGGGPPSPPPPWLRHWQQATTIYCSVWALYYNIFIHPKGSNTTVQRTQKKTEKTNIRHKKAIQEG